MRTKRKGRKPATLDRLIKRLFFKAILKKKSRAKKSSPWPLSSRILKIWTPTPDNQTVKTYTETMKEYRFDQNLRILTKGFRSIREKIQEMRREDFQHRIDQKFLQDRLKQAQILLDSIA